MPRLLVCRECHTIDTIPLWDGPPELEHHDPMLDSVVKRHVQLHGEKLDAAALLTVSEDYCDCKQCKGQYKVWEAHQVDVLNGLRERWTGFHPEFYATKDTFREDALRCYNLHRRPKGTDCVDWHDDRKRLTPSDWKKNHVYLCDFCPVASSVTTAIRLARGMYDREPGETE